jgi:hypothetical protein
LNCACFGLPFCGWRKNQCCRFKRPREHQPTAIASFGMLGMRVPVRQLRGIVTTDSARA